MQSLYQMLMVGRVQVADKNKAPEGALQFELRLCFKVFLDLFHRHLTLKRREVINKQVT